MQQYKSVYFADHPAENTKRRKVTLAFGAKDLELYELIHPLSSEDIRQALGVPTFDVLTAQAEHAGKSVNAVCLQQLRRAAQQGRDGQLSFVEIKPRTTLHIDPIQTTFRGGIEQPLHGWYPYLEGYSPDFVSAVLDEFAPNAQHVLDPFGGGGTTPLTASQRGIASSYCELNPLLQLIVASKSAALTLSITQRKSLIEALLRLADGLHKSVAHHVPDPRLSTSYVSTFRDSEFFTPDTFNTVLRLRTWLDEVACSEPLAADIASIAVVSSLIPASHLIRRGDLRFRKGALETGARLINILDEVSRRIKNMATDLIDIEGFDRSPVFIAADAKRLDRIVPLRADAVMTSPPYLNGTNYYRNTKVELWFLRALSCREDLAEFRRRTVTAGINDVTADNVPPPVSEHVADIVRKLQEDSYDRRIPQMAVSYFSDMLEVFSGLKHHALPNAPLLLDIGDSAYAGVHVDTPAILSDLLQGQGWDVSGEITLRRRQSRSGVELRQVLVVANAPSAIPKKRLAQPRWKRRWADFKRTLPHQKGEFAKRNWGNPLHSLCSYQGKMKPSLARHLVQSFVRPGDRLLDPFGGVGTIPFEAASMGVHSWSFDISPAAIPIAAAKLSLSSLDECEAVLNEIKMFIRSHRVTTKERVGISEIRFNGPLEDYFHSKTLDEIILARRYFQLTPPDGAARSLVFSALLHVLHGNRPYALSRRSHPITPFAPTGETVYKPLVQKVREKVARALAVDRPIGFMPGVSIYQDATALWPAEVDDLDAVITSPPFFDSTRFYQANWMRLWFAGWESDDFKQRPKAFVDERQKASFSVYESIIRQSRERLKPGGVCVFHLGKSKKCDMAEEIRRIGATWFRSSEIFAESVAHCESHGIRDKGTVFEHTYLVLH